MHTFVIAIQRLHSDTWPVVTVTAAGRAFMSCPSGAKSACAWDGLPDSDPDALHEHLLGSATTS